MTNPQTTYPDDEHLADCKSNLGVQYSCDCGYAFRTKDEDAKQQTTTQTRPCGCWSEQRDDGIHINLCEQHKGEIIHLHKKQYAGTVTWVPHE